MYKFNNNSNLLIMKKLLFLASILIFGIANAQVFSENWDGDGPGIAGWTVIDGDGLTPAEPVNFITAGWATADRGGPPPNYGGPDGDFAAASTSWYDPVGTSNDWLISPVISVPDDGEEYFVKWDAKAQDALYPDGYNLMLSTTAGNTLEDFTVTLFSTAAENAEWITRIASLEDYAGEDITLAWVNNSTDQFVLLIDNISVELINVELPDCPTLEAPLNEAVDVDNTGIVTLSWIPAETGGDVTSYSVYVGTSTIDMGLVASTTENFMDITGFASGTTYYWTVLANGIVGTSDACETFSFTTMPSEFDPYCGPLEFSFTVEPITLVDFAGIYNETSPEGTIPHENWIDQTAEVTIGETYDITLKGFTAGSWENRFAVFIDWNQDGEFTGDEIIEISETITNSTGYDDESAVQSITIPESALEGVTRMRVKKIFGTTSYLDPCLGASFGQAQDYSINVSSTMSTRDLTASKLGVYPNPANDVLNIAGKEVQIVKVYNVLGQQMKVTHFNNSVNVQGLASGTYVLQVEDVEGNIKTTKFIKK